VVKELVLKANGLCPREFKSRRCRHRFYYFFQLETYCQRFKSVISTQSFDPCPVEPFSFVSTFRLAMGDWSSGMIPALGAGGREFDSRITPFFVFFVVHLAGGRKKSSPMRGSNPRLAG
jgi:hypothetical protein